MVNWGEFTHRYLSLGDEERQAFLADLLSKGYHETHRLLIEGKMWDEGNALSGFACHIPEVTLEDIKVLCEKSEKLEKSEKSSRLPFTLLRSPISFAVVSHRL